MRFTQATVRGDSAPTVIIFADLIPNTRTRASSGATILRQARQAILTFAIRRTTKDMLPMVDVLLIVMLCSDPLLARKLVSERCDIVSQSKRTPQESLLLSQTSTIV